MSDETKTVYDETTKSRRPQHKGRVRALGSHARLTKKPPSGHYVEVWEGGRFTGYIRVRKQKKYLPGIK